MKAFQICGIKRECPWAMPHQRPFHQSSKSRWYHPAPNQECGASQRSLSRTPITAVITTKYPLVPALARGPNKTTPKSETTLTIPRQGETLVATHTVMSGYLLSERLLCPQSLTIHDREMRRRVRHRVLGVSTAIYQQVPPWFHVVEPKWNQKNNGRWMKRPK